MLNNKHYFNSQRNKINKFIFIPQHIITIFKSRRNDQLIRRTSLINTFWLSMCLITFEQARSLPRIHAGIHCPENLNACFKLESHLASIQLVIKSRPVFHLESRLIQNFELILKFEIFMIERWLLKKKQFTQYYILRN